MSIELGLGQTDKAWEYLNELILPDMPDKNGEGLVPRGHIKRTSWL